MMNIKEMVIESYRKEGAKDERARIRKAQRAAIKALRVLVSVHDLPTVKWAINELDAATKARRKR